MSKFKIRFMYVVITDLIVALVGVVFFIVGLLTSDISTSQLLTYFILIYVFAVSLTLLQLLPTYSYDGKKISCSNVIGLSNLAEIYYIDITHIKYDRLNSRIHFYNCRGERLSVPTCIQNNHKVIYKIHELIYEESKSISSNKAYAQLIEKYLKVKEK